jgi:hypothetical protein
MEIENCYNKRNPKKGIESLSLDSQKQRSWLNQVTTKEIPKRELREYIFPSCPPKILNLPLVTTKEIPKRELRVVVCMLIAHHAKVQLQQKKSQKGN